MSETPTQRADRADLTLERCRTRGRVNLSHLEGLRNDLRAVANEYDDLAADKAQAPHALMPEPFGAWLDEQMRRLDFGPADVAAQLPGHPLSVRNITAWRAGRTTPDLHEAFRLANALGSPVIETLTAAGYGYVVASIVEENDEARAAAEPAAAGTGRRDVLEDILEHWDTHVTDEVDDNPERNPHVGFVPAEKSGLVDALMEWRGGDLNDYVDPFAVHTVTVEYVAGWSESSTILKTTVRHPVDCDRLPYGELCAFDKVSDCGESLYLPEHCAPGEYEALIRRTDNMLGAGEEYIEIGKPVVRES